MPLTEHFHHVRFPIDIAFGSGAGTRRRTEIVTLASGYEQRNTLWRDSKRYYDAGYGIHSLDDIATVIAFFEARYGRLYGFLWRDWADYKSCLPSLQPKAIDQVISTGDGKNRIFQLIKSYVSGDFSWTRKVSKPIAKTVQIAIDGTAVKDDLITVDHLTGLVTFKIAPVDGEKITAGFEFDTPVRFDTDNLDFNLASFHAGEVPSIPITEVRL
jgi:uncharacterized protein (TIGR02217 family)